MHVLDDYMRPEHYEQTEESSGFRQEFETRKAKQVHKSCTDPHTCMDEGDAGWAFL